ncbi:MAG: hypothetical protein ABIR06_08615 [Cyclobacteriaceae bacterium]
MGIATYIKTIIIKQAITANGKERSIRINRFGYILYLGLVLFLIFISSPNSLREELQKNYTSFQKWWSIQLRASLFVFPIAVSGGFILGGVVGSGKTVEAFLYNPRMLLILGITMLVLCPLCYYGAKWMFNYSYGKHLKNSRYLLMSYPNKGD